jgi:hypothetical protein
MRDDANPRALPVVAMQALRNRRRNSCSTRNHRSPSPRNAGAPSLAVRLQKACAQGGTTMTRFVFALALATITTFAFAPRAHAQLTILPSGYSHVGGSCVPDGATVASGALETGGFGVRFKAGHVGTLRLICMVIDPCGMDSTGNCAKISGLRVSAIDPDGTGGAANVSALLHHVPRGSNISGTIGACPSSSSSATGPSETLCDVNPSYRPIGSDLFYWEVLVTRSTTAYNPEFLAVTADQAW